MFTYEIEVEEIILNGFEWSATAEIEYRLYDGEEVEQVDLVSMTYYRYDEKKNKQVEFPFVHLKRNVYDAINKALEDREQDLLPEIYQSACDYARDCRDAALEDRDYDFY